MEVNGQEIHPLIPRILKRMPHWRTSLKFYAGNGDTFMIRPLKWIHRQ